MNKILAWTLILQFITIYEIPLSVPASQGNRSRSKLSFHVQSVSQRFKPFTPTTQSGLGPNMETSEILGCFLSTLKWDEVFAFTLGYHRPAALISVRSFDPLARSSVSRRRAEPHSAKDRKPSVAMWCSPQKLKLLSCDAPITSEKWVSQTANGKSFGCVSFDQMPSKIT